MPHAKKTYNVFIRNISPAWSYCDTDFLQIICEPMTKKETDKIFQKAAHYRQIPEKSCVYGMSLFFNDKLTKSFSVGQKNKIDENSSAGLDIHIQMKNCYKCSRENCFHNVRDGKCTDEFVIDLIGTTLFKDKYQKQK